MGSDPLEVPIAQPEDPTDPPEVPVEPLQPAGAKAPTDPGPTRCPGNDPQAHKKPLLVLCLNKESLAPTDPPEAPIITHQ